MFWQSVESGADASLYEAYLAQYPKGKFALIARAKLAKLRRIEAAGNTPEPVAVAPAGPAVPVPAQPQSATGQALTSPSTIPSTAIPASNAPPAPPVQLPGSSMADAETPSSGPMSSTPSAGSSGAQPPSAQLLPGTVLPNAVPGQSPPFTTQAPPPQPSFGGQDDLGRLLDAVSGRGSPVSPTVSPTVSSPPPANNTTGTSQPNTPPATPAPPSSGVPAVGSGGIAPTAPAQTAPKANGSLVRPIVVGTLPSGFALPPHPQMAYVPSVSLPASFCSADARNQFHNGTYRPAMETAKRNNDAAREYLQRVQAMYDSYQLNHDANPQNALAAEAQDYQPIAEAAFAAQGALVKAFNDLMAVPIIPCEALK
jgi:hypothetical protein